MKHKTVALDDLTKDVLMRSRIEGNNLFLPEQLRPEEYQRVKKAINAAGGKWHRQSGAHVFPGDVRETLNITDDSVSVVNVQQTFQAFYTPDATADLLVDLLDVSAGATILEPSAGSGQLLRALLKRNGVRREDIVAVELNPKDADKLGSLAGEVLCRDFLSIVSFDNQPDGFDAIIMNPPFSNGGDIKHIQHALKFLKPGGRLVSILAAGPRQRAAFEKTCLEWLDLEPRTFKGSGTNVSTDIIVMAAPH